jgi:hypothetical protein
MIIQEDKFKCTVRVSGMAISMSYGSYQYKSIYLSCASVKSSNFIILKERVKRK